MRDWVLVVLEGSSRNKASIRDYKTLRNIFGTSIFRETGQYLSIRKHTASIRRAYAGTLPLGRDYGYIVRPGGAGLGTVGSLYCSLIRVQSCHHEKRVQI